MDATEKILGMIAEMRAKFIPEQYKSKPKARPPEETRMARLSKVGTESLFEVAVILDAIEAFHDELKDMIEAWDAPLVPDFLDVYYMMEEMVQDPRHAELIPHLDRLRKAYYDAYGEPIPPKPEEDE